MAFSKFDKRIFGVGLDPGDDPMSLELKQAWMMNPENGAQATAFCLDPYEMVISSLKERLANCHIEPAGKFPVPSWLTPRPEPADLPLVNIRNIGQFYDRGELRSMLRRLESFVEKQIFPAVPVMVGVDHSATMGVISALARKYGPEKISVIVLDQHFDAIPASVRAAEITGATSTAEASNFQDHLCCGNFWKYLIEERQLLPKNLSFIGVGDYPGETTGDSPFKKLYLDFQEKGCRLFPLENFSGQYRDHLNEFVDKAIKTPYVYISLDLDVCSYNGVLAARYMDRPGISAGNLLETARIIRDTGESKKVRLSGLDIMEFNMHFLGIEMEDGIKDTTIPLVGDFLKEILVGF